MASACNPCCSAVTAALPKGPCIESMLSWRHAWLHGITYASRSVHQCGLLGAGCCRCCVSCCSAWKYVSCMFGCLLAEHCLPGTVYYVITTVAMLACACQQRSKNYIARGGCPCQFGAVLQNTAAYPGPRDPVLAVVPCEGYSGL